MNWSWGFGFMLMAACLPRVGAPIDGGTLETEPDGGRPAECSNAVLDNGESDTDCGGPCVPCPLSANCRTPLDCLSGVCTEAVCVAPDEPCRSAFAGCISFTDFTDGGPVTIRFPLGSNRYSPQCVRIRLGQTVDFEGSSFSEHSLTQACGPLRNTVRANSGQTFTATLEALGVYGYACAQHGSSNGSGMAGAIEVVR